MKEFKITLYKFEELPDDVRKKIVDAKCFDVMYDVMEFHDTELRDTLKKFEEIFGISVSYEVGYCNHSYSFSFDEAVYQNDWRDDFEYEISANDVKGKLLLRYLNGKYYDIRSRKYFSTRGYYDENKKYHYKFRYSRVMWEEGNCPLTGVCYDCDILDPIWKWHKNPDWNLSLYDLIDKCLENFFKDWQSEYDYYGDNKDNCVEEELTERWYEDDLFIADGTKFSGNLDELEELAA